MVDTSDSRFRIVLEAIPPAEMRNHPEKDYLPSSVHVLTFVDQLIPIAPSTRVLDVGCAAGRLASPLLGLLDNTVGGSYEGFDVQANRIEWAKANITSRYPHFRFRHIDVFNQTINPKGTVDGQRFSFPYEPESFDLIIFHSVFTHLIPADGRHYLAEARRCLAPKGRIYSTWYLWDEGTARSVAANEVMWSFPEARISHRIQNAERPELAVAYVYDPLVADIDQSGLTIDTEIRGDWRSRPTHGQDTLILRRV